MTNITPFQDTANKGIGVSPFSGAAYDAQDFHRSSLLGLPGGSPRILPRPVAVLFPRSEEDSYWQIHLKIGLPGKRSF